MIKEYMAGQSQALESSSTEEIGIGGFVLFARVSDSTSYETQAPTSVVENGSFAGDHLINSPITLNISGDVSDIFLNPPASTATAKRVPTVGKTESFMPSRTPSQIQRIARIVNSAQDRFKAIDEKIKLGAPTTEFSGNKSIGKPIREQFIDFIESVHYGKQLISISMPYRKHDSMAITGVTITRDNQRNALTFSLTAQKFRFAETIFANISSFYKKPAPAVKSQTAGVSDKGVQSPTGAAGSAGATKEKSVLSSILGRS